MNLKVVLNKKDDYITKKDDKVDELVKQKECSEIMFDNLVSEFKSLEDKAQETK